MLNPGLSASGGGFITLLLLPIFSFVLMFIGLALRGGFQGSCLGQASTRLSSQPRAHLEPGGTRIYSENSYALIKRKKINNFTCGKP